MDASTTAADSPLLFVSVEEAARRLGLGRTTIFKLIASGGLKTAKVRRRRLVSTAELDRFVHRMEREAS
jgi:excisionase family DNA binding protein